MASLVLQRRLILRYGRKKVRKRQVAIANLGRRLAPSVDFWRGAGGRGRICRLAKDPVICDSSMRYVRGGSARHVAVRAFTLTCWMRGRRQLGVTGAANCADLRLAVFRCSV